MLRNYSSVIVMLEQVWLWALLRLWRIDFSLRAWCRTDFVTLCPCREFALVKLSAAYFSAKTATFRGRAVSPFPDLGHGVWDRLNGIDHRRSFVGPSASVRVRSNILIRLRISVLGLVNFVFVN